MALFCIPNMCNETDSILENFTKYIPARSLFKKCSGRTFYAAENYNKIFCNINKKTECGNMSKTFPHSAYTHYFLINSSTGNYIAHVISSSWLSCKEFGSLNCALSKYSLGICSMLKLDYLILTCENHFMLTYNRQTLVPSPQLEIS